MSPPPGFDRRRPAAARGRVEVVEYDSTTVAATRPAVVYTPPGYPAGRAYPVLYLLHGIGDAETGWWRKGSAAAAGRRRTHRPRKTPPLP